ncbi:ATP-binding protein [Conexibacter stalactiti]|uniref:histidine kinase n=1 Tax=Conexibacter stalactiti TaxID=1940611 RepID=A0ABU4I281_9ACTN|nr:ATP-binding protein [Conexibacter stalactiti]MDW5598399.1 histidine kinase [Conexibacter stalactiti]MEC5039041.1 ATP-binding protein [Conexibacter stalactiti]
MIRAATDRLPAVAVLPRRHALTLAVAGLAAAALLFGLSVLALLYSGVSEPPPWQAALFVACGWVYVAAGAVAWLRRPNSRIGLLMVAGGFAWLTAALWNSPVPALQAAGQVVSTLGIALLIHLLLAFPSGRLDGTAARVTTIAAYVTSLVLQAPKYLFGGTGPLSVADRPDLYDAGVWTQRACGALVVIAATVLLVRRLRALPPPQRRLLAPLDAYGIVAILLLPTGRALADLDGAADSLNVFVLQIALISGAPIAFAVAALRGGFGRTAELEELGAWLGAEDRGRPQLSDLLAATLGDPTVELLFRVPGRQGWLNGAGVTAVPPTASAGRGVAEVELAGTTIGAIVYDATLLPRPEEVCAAARVIALALDRERLTVELRASRARLVEAGDQERRRIARDLHDGLQSRLVLLAVQAGVAPLPEARTELRLGIETAIDELRALVHGVMPAELTERGLPAAVEALADRMPIAVVLEVDGLRARLPPAVESTGYFVVSEALVNAVKHAHASELAVGLARLPSDLLRIEVSDDGIGGAGARGGNGIRSIADRVEALGGRVRIDSATGAGTRVVVELPCAS